MSSLSLFLLIDERAVPAMQVFVNDQTHYLQGQDVAALLTEINAPAERVVVVVNGTVIPRDQRGGKRLKAEDRIEVFTFAGGG